MRNREPGVTSEACPVPHLLQQDATCQTFYHLSKQHHRLGFDPSTHEPLGYISYSYHGSELSGILNHTQYASFAFCVEFQGQSPKL